MLPKELLKDLQDVADILSDKMNGLDDTEEVEVPTVLHDGSEVKSIEEVAAIMGVQPYIAAVFTLQSTDVSSELAAEAKSIILEEKVIRRVRSIAGQNRFGQPIGSIIVRDAPLHWIRDALSGRPNGYYEDSEGDRYHVYKVSTGTSGDTWTWYATTNSDDRGVMYPSEEDALAALDRYVAAKPSTREVKPRQEWIDAGTTKVPPRPGRVAKRTPKKATTATEAIYYAGARDHFRLIKQKIQGRGPRWYIQRRDSQGGWDYGTLMAATPYTTERRAREALQDYDPTVVLSGKPIDDGPTEFVLHHGVSGLDNDTRYDLTQNANGWIIRYKSPGTNNEWRVSLAGTFPTRQAAEETLHDLVPSDLYRMIHPHVREAEAGPISFVNEADSAVYKLADDENGYWHINGPGVDAERKYQTRDEAEAVLRQWFPRVRQVVKKTAKKRVTKRPAQPTKPLDFENDENEFHIAQRRDGKWIINMRTRGSRGAWDQVMRGTFARNDFDSHQEAVQTLKDDWGDIRVRDTSRVVKTAKKLTKKAAATPSNTYGLNPAVLDRLTPEGPPEDMVFRGSDGEKYRIRRDPDVAETADRPHWMVEKWYANVSGRTGGWVPNFISNFGTQQLAAERLNSALPERTAQPAFGVGSIRPLTDQQRRALESARALNVTDEEFMPLELDGDEYSNIMDVGDMWYRGRNGRFYTLRREGDTAQIRDEEGMLLSEFEDSGDAFNSLNKIAERWEDALMAPDDRAAKPVRPNRPSDFAVSVALGEKDPYAHLSLSERIGLAEWVNEAISGHESLASSSLGPGMVAGLRTNRVYRIFQAPEATDWMADTASNLTNANAGQYLDPFIRADTLSALVAQLDTEEAEPPSLFPIPDRENYYQGADNHEYVVRRDTRTNLWAAFRVEPDRSESQVGDYRTQREDAVHNAERSAQGLESFQPTRNWQERRDRLTRLTGGVVSRLYRGSDDNFYKISPVTKKDGGGWRIEKRLGADNWEVHTNINFISESVAADWLNEQMPQPTVPKNDMPDWANLNFTVVNRDSMTFTGSTGTLMRIVSDRGIWYAEAQREDNGTWFRVTIPDHHSPREVAEYINANQPSIVSPSAPKEADAYVLGTVDSRFNHLRLSGVNGLTTVDEQGVKYTGVHHQDGVNGDYWTLRIERPNGAFFLLPTDNTLTDVRHFPEWYDAMVWADEASGDLDAALMSNIAQTEGRPVTRNPPMVTSWYTGRHNYRVVDNGRGSNEWFAEVLVREGPRGKEVWAQAVPTRGVFASQAEATAALQGFDPTARSGRSTPSEPLPSPSAARTDQGPSAHPTRTDGSPYVHLTITDDSLVYMGTNGHRYRIDFNTDGALVQGEMEGVRPRHWPTLTRRYATIDEALEWADRRAAEGTSQTRSSTGIHPIDGSGTAYAGLSLTDNPLVFQGENGSKYKVGHEDDGYHVYIPSGDERGWISTTIGLATYDEAMHWANDRAIEITQWNRERQAREQNITMEEVENLLGPSSTNVVVNGVNMSFLTDIGDVTRNVFEDNNGHVYRVVAAGPDMGDPPRWHLYQDGALVATENSRDTAVEHANLLAQRGGDVSIVGHPMQGYPHLIVEGLRSDGVHEGGRFRTPVGTVFWVHYNTATEKYEVEKDGVLDSDHITYTEALEAAEAIAAAETPVPATNESPYQFYSFRGDERQYRLFSHYGSDGTVLWEIEEQGEEEDENGEIWHPIPMGAGFYTREGAEDALRRYDPSIQADTSVPATTGYQYGDTTYPNLTYLDARSRGSGTDFVRGTNGQIYEIHYDVEEIADRQVSVRREGETEILFTSEFYPDALAWVDARVRNGGDRGRGGVEPTGDAFTNPLPITPAVLLSSLNASNAFTPMQAGGITLRNLERMPDVEERFHAGSQVRDYTGTVYSLIQSGDDWQTVVYNADGSHRSMTSAGSAAEALAILNNHVPPAPEPASNAEPLPTPVKKTTGRRRGRQVRANGTVLKHIRRKGSTETYYGDDGSVYSITDTGLTGGWGHRRTYTVRGASNNFIQEVQGLPEAQRYLDSYIARGGGNDNAPLSGLSALIGQPISDGTYNFGQHGSMTVRRTNYYEDQYEVTVRTPQRNILLTLRKLPDGIWETRPYSDNDPHHAAQVDTAGSSVFEAIYLLNRELGDPDLPHGAQPSNIHFTPPEEIAPGVITEEQLKTGILSSGTYRMGEMTFDVSMSSYDSEQMNVVVHDPNGPENNRITLFRQYNTQRWQARDESTYRRTGDNLTSGAALYSVLTTRQRQIDARTRLFTGGYANLTVHAVDDGGTTIKADVLTEPFTIELGTNNEGEVTYTFTRVNRFTGPSFRQAMYARINQKKYTDVEQAIADIVEAINAPDPLEKARQLAHSGKKMKMKYPPSGGGSMNLDDPELDPEIVAWCIQAFEGEFGKGSLRTELKLGESSVSHDYFHIHGTILNDSGAIATFQRTINRRSKELHNDYLSLPDTVRGQGFAEEFYHHVEQYVAEGGIVNVTVNANINVGSYAWARRGFDITSSRSYAFSTLYDRLKRYRNNPPERFEFDLDEDGKVINTRTLPPVPFEEWQLALIDHFLKRLQEADPRLTMREIAGFSEDWYQWMGKTEEGRPLHLHLGKKIMLGGFSWDGRKDVLYGFEKKSDEFSEVETGEEYMARLMAFLPEAEKLFIPGDFYEDSVHNDYNVMFADLLLPPRTFPETKGW